MTFTNEPLDLGDLPALEEQRFHPLAPAHLRASMLGHGLVVTVVAVAGLLGLVVIGWIPAAIAGVILVLVSLSTAHSVVAFRHIGWQVREHDMSYRRGVLVRTVQSVPFVRVQHTRITRSLVQRRFGLATLHVSTAGPDLAIEGLGVADAERLKALIVQRAGDLDEAPA